MTLSISDGVTTVTLSGDLSVIKACDYFPATPERKGNTYNDVTESFHVIMEGAPATIIATVNTIETLLNQATLKRRKSKRLIVTYNVTGIAETHKSEVLEGRVVWDSDPLYRRLQDATAAVQVQVIWKRRFYWELASVTLPTETVVNGDDGAAGNSFVWDDIGGVLPAPVRITLTNASGEAMQTRRFYILNDAHDLLGTDAFITPATATATWGGAIDHNTILWPLTLPEDMAAAVAGERYRILAAFSSLPSGVYVRATVYADVGGVYVMLQRGGDALSTNKKLLDLGAFDLPPAGEVGAPLSLVIVLSVYAPSAGTATLSFVQVSPAEPALTLVQNGFSMGVGQSIVHDGMDGVNYLALSQRHSVVSADGALLLYPGQENRIRILFDEDTSFDPERELTVSAAYRPRKLTV